MFPYNSKSVDHSAGADVEVVDGERVAVVDFKRLLENVLYERDDVGLGAEQQVQIPALRRDGRNLSAHGPMISGQGKDRKELAAVDTARRRSRFQTAAATPMTY